MSKVRMTNGTAVEYGYVELFDLRFQEFFYLMELLRGIITIIIISSHSATSWIDASTIFALCSSPILIQSTYRSLSFKRAGRRPIFLVDFIKGDYVRMCYFWDCIIFQYNGVI